MSASGSFGFDSELGQTNNLRIGIYLLLSCLTFSDKETMRRTNRKVCLLCYMLGKTLQHFLMQDQRHDNIDNRVGRNFQESGIG